MKKIILNLLLLASIFVSAQVKIGNNPTTIGTSSLLELESTNKALVISRVANTAAVTNPVKGMIIFDLSSNCFKGYLNGVWSDCGLATPPAPSTGGTAVVSSYGTPACTANSISGTMSQGIPVSGVTMTLYANVTTLGTYNISATNNGVTFSGTGTFYALGCQPVVLTAFGTPTANGSFTWTTSTTPSASVSATVNSASSGGSAVISSFGTPSCSANTINGTMIQGLAVSGVTMTLYANVTTVGTYNISAVNDGVTFTGSGTIAATGCQAITLTASGTPTASGPFTWTTNTTPAAAVASTVLAPISIPATITLAQSKMYFVASVYDQDYLPYTSPAGAATTTTPVAANGSNEPVTVNVQGTITTTGASIKIPVTCTGSGTLPAWSVTVNVPASLTQDGISRNVTFSWASQAFTSSTVTIVATIKSVGGTLNAKKLDINAGIGNDALGVLMGTFSYPYNSANAYTTYQVRDIAGIPDKMMGIADNHGSTTTHNMLYIPIVAEDGRTWLNNNLGAHYSTIGHASFNPTAQATSDADYLAYGSMFQWGRKANGFELINWTAYNNGTPLYSEIDYTANDNPVNLCLPGQTWEQNIDDNRWNSEASANNPCPYGFRLPTKAEWLNLTTAAGITSIVNASTSALKIPFAGYRNNGGGMAAYNFAGFWTSDTANNGVADQQRIFGGSIDQGQNIKVDGISVRCIKD